MGTNPSAVVEPLPNPSVPEVQQQQDITPIMPLPVVHDGPINTQQLPSRMGPIITQALSTATAHVLGQDEKRRRTVCICDVDWLVSRTSSGVAAPWYAKVPLVLENADSLYAKVSTGTGTLTVVTEMWAD